MVEALDVVRRYFDAFGEGNVEGALTCVHPEAIWHIDGDRLLVTAGIVQGRAAVRAWLARFPSGFRPLTFSVERLIDAAPDVIAVGRFRHVVQATGAIVDSDYALRLTLRDGLIARYQIFEDSLLLSQAHRDASPARRALVNGTDYGWDDIGQGPPVILLHGLFLDRTFWNRCVDDLAGEHRCISFDMPGHGASGWRDGLDLDRIADDIALWIGENGAAGATLVGHSQGGMVAMRIAIERPELARRLVLINTSARSEYADRLLAWRTRKTSLAGSVGERTTAFAEIQRLKASPEWLEAHQEEAERERAMMMRHDPAIMAHATDAAVLARPDIRGRLNRIITPTMVLSGARDQATPPELGLEISKLIRDAEHYLVEDVGHHIPVEKPNAVLDAVAPTRKPDGPVSGFRGAYASPIGRI